MCWGFSSHLWSAVPDDVRISFHSNTERQRRNGEKNIYGTYYKDYRCWSSDPNILKEFFYEQRQLQCNMAENSSFVTIREMYESISRDKENIIVVLSHDLKPLVPSEELNALLNSNLYKSDNICDNNRLEMYLHNYENTLPLNELYNSFLNEQDKIIYGLKNHLRNYNYSNNKINELLNLNKNAYHKESGSYYQNIYYAISFILNSLKHIFSNYIMCKLFENNRNESIIDKHVSCHERKDKIEIENFHQPILCQSNENHNYYPKEVSEKLNNLDESSKILSTMHVNNCNKTCNTDIQMYDRLLEMNQEMNQLLCYIRLRNISKSMLLLEMKKYNAMLKKK